MYYNCIVNSSDLDIIITFLYGSELEHIFSDITHSVMWEAEDMSDGSLYSLSQSQSQDLDQDSDTDQV